MSETGFRIFNQAFSAGAELTYAALLTAFFRPFVPQDKMHLDDWTIARLLGHKSLKNVKYYRKMSNQILPNDTRKARNRLSQMVLECLDGWEEEYEQIRYDDSL